VNLPSFPNIDLFSAGINALNGVLVRTPSVAHRGYAVVGLLIMAFFGGIARRGAGRVLNDIPSPLKDPAYLLVCLLMGAGAGDLSLRRLEGGTVSHEDAAFINLSRCHGLRSWARIKALDHDLGSSPRSSSG